MGEQGPPAVEVVYALPERQWIVSVPLAEGLTAIEAVRRSGLLANHPEIQDHPLVLGLFGVAVGPEHRLVAGDRVEICRPLVEDPRDMRRHLLETGRVMGQRDED